MWIQIVISVIIIVAWWRLVFNYRKGKTPLSASVVWFCIWAAIGIVFWSPEIASRLAVMAGIGRGADLIVYSSIIVLVYFAYRVYVRIEKIERDLTQLTRKLALYDEHERDHRSDPDSQL